MSAIRTAILISGRGSNMMSLIAAANKEDYPAKICLVISSNPQAPGLKKATEAGITATGIDHKAYESREAFETEMQRHLDSANIELICLAGFMHLITEGFVNSWQNRMINIHPSLLPAYKGLDTHRRVLRDGGKITGCTVHYVHPLVDSGPIIAQAEVDILPDDTPEILAARVLEAEHRLYPMALRLVADRTVKESGDKVRCGGEDLVQPALITPNSNS